MSSSKGAILFLTSWYPVNENPTHGIFIRNHALALSRYQKVIIVYAYSSATGPYYKPIEIKINENLTEIAIKYSKPLITLKPFSSAIQFLKLRKAHHFLIHHLLQSKFEIKAIQVNVVFPAAVVLDEYKKHFNVEHTVLDHWSGYLLQDGNYHGSTLKRFTEKCISTANKIWHISQPQKDAMLSHGLKGKYELIYNAVNTEVFTPQKNTSPRIKLLHVSSLVEREKNISGTFRVVKALQDKGYDFDFVVAGGDGEELQAAKNLAQQLKIKNISFTGILSPGKIAAEMQCATALILFSHFEGMPVVVLEAMSCGLPIIASKVGQLPFMITNEFGMLVDVNNEAQLLQVLEAVCSNTINFNKAAMREFVLKHASYEAVGKQMSEFYK
jgi:L-malate glycosyltransferase